MTLAFSWGPWGGVYAHWGYCKRLCLGWFAVTLVPVEVDDLMAAFAACAACHGNGVIRKASCHPEDADGSLGPCPACGGRGAA
jgi:hypothetical protein